MLQFHDKDSIGVPMKNANVRIASITINPGLPLEERAESVFTPILDDEKNPVLNDDGSPKMEETLGEIISTTKTYNINIWLDYLDEDCTGIYNKEQVSVNGLIESDLKDPLPSLYKALKTLAKFKDAKDV